MHNVNSHDLENSQCTMIQKYYNPYYTITAKHNTEMFLYLVILITPEVFRHDDKIIIIIVNNVHNQLNNIVNQTNCIHA